MNFPDEAHDEDLSSFNPHAPHEPNAFGMSVHADNHCKTLAKHLPKSLWQKIGEIASRPPGSYTLDIGNNHAHVLRLLVFALADALGKQATYHAMLETCGDPYDLEQLHLSCLTDEASTLADLLEIPVSVTSLRDNLAKEHPNTPPQISELNYLQKGGVAQNTLTLSITPEQASRILFVTSPTRTILEEKRTKRDEMDEYLEAKRKAWPKQTLHADEKHRLRGIILSSYAAKRQGEYSADENTSLLPSVLYTAGLFILTKASGVTSGLDDPALKDSLQKQVPQALRQSLEQAVNACEKAASWEEALAAANEAVNSVALYLEHQQVQKQRSHNR